MVLNHFVFAAAILGLSIGLVVVVMTAIFFRNLAIPDASNATPKVLTPSLRTGGLAVVGAFLTGIFAIHMIGDFTPIKARYFWGFSTALLFVSAISLYSTFKTVDFRIKLVGQAFAVAVVMYAGIVIDEIHLPWFGWVVGGWWVYPMTLLWILGLTNVYGRMDAVDGLAASSAVVASMFLIFITFHQESVFIYLCSVTLFAASVGFLVFNFPPAKIFMGDIGSTFLGFSFAVMAIIAALYDRSHTSLFVIPLLLFHFIFDVIFTHVTRLRHPRSESSNQIPYIYQLLVRIGHPQGRVILISLGMSFAQGIGAIFMVNIYGDSRIFVFLPFLLFQAAYAYWVVGVAKRRNRY